MSRKQHLTSSPGICHGKVCIKGTRITVASILDELAGGRSVAAILANWPSLTNEDVLAAAEYGAEIAKYRGTPFPSARE